MSANDITDALGPSDSRLETLCAAHGAYPSGEPSSPIEAALYALNPFALKDEQTRPLRFAAIRASFAYHFAHNRFYRRYCEVAAVFPDSLQDPQDLLKVPLVPEHTFKGCSEPGQFIPWLQSISSDEIAWPEPGTTKDSFDEQIAALRCDYGIQVRATSGSSGVPSFLPRDDTTRRRSAHWKILTYFAMYREVLALSDLLSVTLWPLDFSWAELVTARERVHALLDKRLGVATVIQAMTTPRPRRIIDRLLGREGNDKGRALLVSLVDRLVELAGSGAPGILWTPPFVLYSLAKFALEQGKRPYLGAEWRIKTGGGWKLLRERPLAETELRTLASQAFGVPLDQIHDIYGSTECLGLCGLSCEGGFKHIPHTVLHPLVLDDQMQSVGEGKWGRFAYLNPLIQAYPGFIVTGDRVRMWQRCPACDRTGPILDPRVSRMPGAEERGCANIVQQLIDEQL
jgi:hypothetical protein